MLIAPNTIKIMTLRSACPIIAVILSIFFIGCKPKALLLQGDYPEFNPLETTRIVDEFDDYIQEVEFLPLITPDSLPVYGVKKLLITDDNRKDIVAMIGGRVFKFDRNGNLLFEVGRRGRGPGEYTVLEDICFNEEQTELWMLCQSNEILKYDLGMGKYLTSVKEEKPIPPYGSAISPAANGGFFLFVANPMSMDITTMEEEFFCLKQYDAGGKLISESIPPTDFNLKISLIPSITKSYDDTYLLMPQENENICYEIKDGVVSQLCKIHFGSENIEPLYAYTHGQSVTENLVPIIRSDFYKYPMLLHKTRHHLYFLVIGPGARQDYFIVNLDDFNGIHWHDEPNPPPSSGEPFNVIGADDTYFYGVFNYFGEYTDEQIENFNPMVRYLIRKHNIRLEESANPAIIKFKLSNSKKIPL